MDNATGPTAQGRGSRADHAHFLGSRLAQRFSRADLISSAPEATQPARCRPDLASNAFMSSASLSAWMRYAPRACAEMCSRMISRVCACRAFVDELLAGLVEQRLIGSCSQRPWHRPVGAVTRPARSGLARNSATTSRAPAECRMCPCGRSPRSLRSAARSTSAALLPSARSDPHARDPPDHDSLPYQFFSPQINTDTNGKSQILLLLILRHPCSLCSSVGLDYVVPRRGKARAGRSAYSASRAGGLLRQSSPPARGASAEAAATSRVNWRSGVVWRRQSKLLLHRVEHAPPPRT